jgi:hypothetical protein
MTKYKKKTLKHNMSQKLFEVIHISLTLTISTPFISNENEITCRFERRFTLSDCVVKRQEYSGMPIFSRLVRQAARLSQTGNLFNSRSLTKYLT